MAGEYRSSIIGDLKLSGAEPTEADRVPVAVVLELNARFHGSPSTLTQAFFETWAGFRNIELPPEGPPVGLTYVTSRMYQAVLSRVDVAALIAYDRSPDRHRPHTIFKAWPDYVLTAHIDRSMTTVKADAAFRAFSATGQGVVWAVIDSGIDAAHPHFSELGIAEDLRRQGQPPPNEDDEEDSSPTFGLHRDFTYLVEVGPNPEGGTAPAVTDSPLTDDDGHGTHVAGIIAGRCPDGHKPHIASGDEPVGKGGFTSRAQSAALSGMAHECELVSLKVLRLAPSGLLVTSSSAILRALDYIRTEVNTVPGMPRVHGVNISMGCEWDAAHYAAGRSPLCQAIDDLVRSGVVVVVSAGNGGQAQGANRNDTIALMGSITEPAHADKCIAVGSTHRDAPHVFGITYTSGKGPTLDGRCKPDVVAPGEWITSAATGRLRERSGMADLPEQDGTLTYAPDSGTSMAAPHVSGVIAAFLSVHPEFIGQVDEVKKILCENATDLGRERYAQGHGLVDLMRMLSQT